MKTLTGTKTYLLLFVLLFLLMSSCSPAAVPPKEIDINDLPQNLDVETVNQIQSIDNVLLLDVREPWEYEKGHIPGITLFPMNEIPERINEIPTTQTVIITCNSGNRSNQVTSYLRQNGYENIHNMLGGIVAWQEAGYNIEK